VSSVKWCEEHGDAEHREGNVGGHGVYGQRGRDEELEGVDYYDC